MGVQRNRGGIVNVRDQVEDEVDKTLALNQSHQVITNILSYEEERHRLHLEQKVERAFYQAGKALEELHNRKLYRSTHRTFEEYCKDRFGFERRHPYRLIEAASVVDNLMKMCPNGTQDKLDLDSQMCPNGTQDKLDLDSQMCPNGTQDKLELDSQMCPNGTQDKSDLDSQMCPNGTQILPTSERQVRPLVPLVAKEQFYCWQKAVDIAGGKVPSGRIVKDIVERIRERTLVPIPYTIGEVCIIIIKDNPELRGKSGYWCIVTRVASFSIEVKMWDGEYIVKPENLKSLDFLEDDCSAMSELCSRLRRLYNIKDLDEVALSLLNSLGKRTKPYLTPVQEKVLAVIEQEYGIE
jgi:hypothetical protein